jgi:hypothetical protein
MDRALPRSLHYLRELRVRYSSITDRNLALLAARVKTLEVLDVSGVSTLTEAGFLALVSLPRLEVLIARSTGITDLAVANILLCLEVRGRVGCGWVCGETDCGDRWLLCCTQEEEGEEEEGEEEEGGGRGGGWERSGVGRRSALVGEARWC